MLQHYQLGLRYEWLDDYGLPGEVYTTGLSAAWLAIGLTIGAYINYLVVLHGYVCIQKKLEMQ